jgi:hypothetical protein
VFFKQKINLNRFNYQKMKKLVLFAAVVVAISFSSCKKTTDASIEAPAVEEVIVEEAVEEVPVEGDSVIVDEIVEDAAVVEAE